MKRYLYIFAAAVLLLCGCDGAKAQDTVPAVSGTVGSAEVSTGFDDTTVAITTEAPATVHQTEATETEEVTETEAVTETTAVETETTITETEPVTEPVTEAVPDEAPAVVTEATTAAPPPPPIDYTNLSGEYGFEPDVSPDRTWADMAPGGQAIDPAKPMIALTFDDGPSPHTERLLNVFAENGGKGTFFVVGYLIEGREHILQRITSEGHEIGGHSWWHSNLTTLSERAVADEIMMTRQRIYAATGVDTRIARPPYGAHNEFVRWVAGQVGVAFVNWSVDTVDWRTRNADAVYAEVMAGAADGAIILCHDLHGTTVDAMERAVPDLIEAGYQLVTVSEMMQYSGAAFESGRVYNRK